MGSRSVTWLVNTWDTWFQQTLGTQLVLNHFDVLSLRRSQPCPSIRPLVGAPDFTPDRHGPGTRHDRIRADINTAWNPPRPHP